MRKILAAVLFLSAQWAYATSMCCPMYLGTMVGCNYTSPGPAPMCSNGIPCLCASNEVAQCNPSGGQVGPGCVTFVCKCEAVLPLPVTVPPEPVAPVVPVVPSPILPVVPMLPVTAGPSAPPVPMVPPAPLLPPAPPVAPPAPPAPPLPPPPCGAASRCGTITAMETGQLLEGVTLELRNKAGSVIHRMKSDANGKYSFDGLAVGEKYYVDPAVDRGQGASPSYQNQVTSQDSNFQIRGVKATLKFTDSVPGSFVLFSPFAYTMTQMPIMEAGGPINYASAVIYSEDGTLSFDIPPGDWWYLCFVPPASGTGPYQRRTSIEIVNGGVAPQGTYSTDVSGHRLSCK